MARSKTVVTVISKISDHPVGKEAALIVIYGPDLGKKYPLDKAIVLVGRSSKSEIQIDQESISRNHCRFLNDGRKVMVRDLGSTNGTYVNDEHVDEHVLKNGDLIKIGRTIFKFVAGGNIENLYHEEIYRLTTIDGLTQVFNKRYFLETLDREMSRCRRYDRSLSLLMFDLDHFKKINDTYGHLAGDHILKGVASLVKGRIRREDVLARFGGEEFALILPEIEPAQGLVLGEKLRKIVERQKFTFDKAQIPVTISIGVAKMPPGTTDPQDFLRIVDKKLYEAKSGGRNRVC